MNDHKQIPIPKINWAYKLEPATIAPPAEASSEFDFCFVVSYLFAKWAKNKVLTKGLLESIEFCQDDLCLSALKLTFNNGKQKQMAIFGSK